MEVFNEPKLLKVEPYIVIEKHGVPVGELEQVDAG